MENSNQFLDLSQAEMLDLWKCLHHLQPSRRDCTVERDDGIDLDTLLLNHIDRWYAELLLTAPIHLLPVEDVATDVTLTGDDEGVVTAILPPQCVRPVEWQLQEWKNSVTHFAQPDEEEARRQRNVWTRGGCETPVIVDHGNRLLLYSLPGGSQPALVMARCVVRPVDGRYRFHSSLLPGDCAL